MNSDRYLEYLIVKVGKLSSFLKKIKSKRARDNELRDRINKAKKHSPEFINSAIKKMRSDSPYLKKIDKFNKQYLGGYKSRVDNIVLSVISERKSEKYIPESVFVNHIEPRLNDISQVAGLMEKNIHDILFHDFNRPEIVMRIVKGDCYDRFFDTLSVSEAEKILTNYNKPLIVKPSFHGQGGGKNIKLYSAGNDNDLLKFFHESRSKSSDVIIQGWIGQHQILSEINPGSVNTLKIVTLRMNGRIEYLMTRLNIGKGSSFIDKGGYFVGVDDDGVVRSSAIDVDTFSKSEAHKDTGNTFKTLKIPSFHKAIEMCKKAHKRLLHFDIISWDVAINSDENPVLIEMNLKGQDVQYNQMASGPLFGDYTEEVLEKMQINLHFNI